MMIDIEQLKADREAGTDGPWWTDAEYSHKEAGCAIIAARTDAGPLPGNPTRGMVAWSSELLEERASICETNARRIARLPELEAAYTEVVAKLDMAVEALGDIENPISYLEREAEKAGAEGLNSNAVVLAKDYAFLQLLATNALAAIKGAKA